MRTFKDISITIVLLLLVVAGFYAFQLLVLGIFGLVAYWCMPIVRQFLHRRPKWK